MPSFFNGIFGHKPSRGRILKTVVYLGLSARDGGRGL